MSHGEEDTNSINNADRSLRIVTLACWLPAFPFLLVHGIASEMLCPVLGIIPMSFSAVAAWVHLSGLAKHRGANIFVDLFIACFLIGILIPGWVFISDGWRVDAGQVMVGTYGTVPMMINFVIHSWFVLRKIPLRSRGKNCPHCHGDLNKKRSQSSTRAMSQFSSDSKESYEPVNMVDADAGEGPSYNHHDSNQPRRSTDDETARLV